MYEISNGPSTLFMKDIFPINGRNPYIPRKNQQFSRPLINTVYHRTKIISNLGPKILNLVPGNLEKKCYSDKFNRAIN